MNNRIKVLTMGAVVQKNCVEAALVGWADRKESWVIENYVFPGNPNDSDDDCWNSLDEVIIQDFFKTNGQVLKIQVCLIDATFENASVMNFCERFTQFYNNEYWRGVYPAYSKQSLSTIIKEHGSTIMTPEILVNYQKLEFELYNNLKQHREKVLNTTKLALAGLYQMFFKYFKALNAHRKFRKHEDIKPNWQTFWDMFEEEAVEEMKD